MEQTTPEEAFRYCSENPDNLSVTQLLDKFPMYREELAPLLLLQRRMSNSFSETLPAERRAAMKQRLLAAARAEQPTVIATAPVIVAPKSPQQEARPARRPFWTYRPVWVAAGAIAAVLLVWFFAASSLPDNPLYNVKLTSENVLLNLDSGSKLARGHIQLANNRLYDLRSMQVAERLNLAGSAFDNYGEHLDDAARIAGTLPSAEQVELDKLLYPSTVAGNSVFDGFGDALDPLSPELQQQIAKTKADLINLRDTSHDALQVAGIDPAQALSAADPGVQALLTPAPGATLPTPTTLAVATSQPTPNIPSTATSVATAQPEPTPLFCADSYENDDLPDQAKPIDISAKQQHFFCPSGDSDWIGFIARAGQVYSIATSQLSDGVDTTITLFAADRTTALASNDNAQGSNGASEITYQPTIDGWYYVQVKNKGDGGAPKTGYTFSVNLIGGSPGTPAAGATPTAP